MKADKAVCTSDHIGDLHSTIRYEAILSTLVDQKISAIKRECEEKERRAKQRRKKNCLGGLLFNKRRAHNDEETHKATVDNADDKTRSHQSLRPSTNKGGDGEAVAHVGGSRAGIDNNADVENAIVLVNNSKLCGSHDANEHRRVPDKCELSVMNERECSTGIVSTSAERLDLSQGSDVIQDNVNIENSPNLKDSKCQIATNSVCSSDERLTVELEKQVVEADETSSKNSTRGNQAEFSDDAESLKHILRTRKYSSDTVSYPSTSKHATFRNMLDVTSALDASEQQHRIRILEAKSISAQCSPIFPRQMFGNFSTPNKRSDQMGIGKSSVLKSPKSQRISTRPTTSDDNVNVTFGRVLVNDAMVDNNDVSDKSSESCSKRSTKRTFKKKDKLASGSNSNAVTNDARGFISSFNHLTSNHLPVITTTKLKSAGDGDLNRPHHHFLSAAITKSDAFLRDRLSPRKMSIAIKGMDGSVNSEEDRFLRKHSECSSFIFSLFRI